MKKLIVQPNGHSLQKETRLLQEGGLIQSMQTLNLTGFSVDPTDVNSGPHRPQPGVAVDDALVVAVKSALRDCAAWHKTPQVVVRHATEPDLAKRLSD
jgi:hypothetical protein